MRPSELLREPEGGLSDEQLAEGDYHIDELRDIAQEVLDCLERAFHTKKKEEAIRLYSKVYWELYHHLVCTHLGPSLNMLDLLYGLEDAEEEGEGDEVDTG